MVKDFKLEILIYFDSPLYEHWTIYTKHSTSFLIPFSIWATFTMLEVLGRRLQMFFELRKQRNNVWRFNLFWVHKCSFTGLRPFFPLTKWWEFGPKNNTRLVGWAARCLLILFYFCQLRSAVIIIIICNSALYWIIKAIIVLWSFIQIFGKHALFRNSDNFTKSLISA